MFIKSFEEAIYNIEKNNPEDFEKLDWKAISSFKYLSEEFIDYYTELKSIY